MEGIEWWGLEQEVMDDELYVSWIFFLLVRLNRITNEGSSYVDLKLSQCG
jgi:hypothetical protein